MQNKFKQQHCLPTYLAQIAALLKLHKKNNYSALCVCGMAVGVKMCGDKALGGAIGNVL